MRNFRIIFTEMDLFNGRIIDREFSTKWLTVEELELNPHFGKADSRVVAR